MGQRRAREETERRAREILDLTYDALKKSLSDPDKLPPVNQLTAVWNAFAGKEGAEYDEGEVVIRLPEEANEYAE